MSQPVFEVVGSSPNFNLPGVCVQCDGDGQLAETDRAACSPDEYPEETITCPDCKGAGGKDPKAVAKSRALWAQYRRALLEESGQDS